jgi:hypothetical protein
MAEPVEFSAVRSDAEAASDSSPAAVASTAARALSLGSSLATPDALRGMDRELAAIGLINYLPYWFWRHSASHDPEIWQSEKCSEMLGLDPII